MPTQPGVTPILEIDVSENIAKTLGPNPLFCSQNEQRFQLPKRQLVNAGLSSLYGSREMEMIPSPERESYLFTD
jgi:hypothetical protein